MTGVRLAGGREGVVGCLEGEGHWMTTPPPQPLSEERKCEVLIDQTPPPGSKDFTVCFWQIQLWSQTLFENLSHGIVAVPFCGLPQHHNDDAGEISEIH